MKNITRCLLLAFTMALGGNWVTSGGDPARTGLSDEFGPTQPDLVWQGTVNGLFGLPVFIWQDRLVTCRFQTIDYAPIVCQSIDDGRIIWTRDFPGTNSRSIPVGFRDNRVYAINFQESHYDTLYALSPDNGTTIWRARMTVEMSITESVTFCENGDLLVQGSGFKIARINCMNGDTVWTCYRLWPVTGSCDLCVFGNTAYGYYGTIAGISLIAIDLATGRIRDSVRLQDMHPGGPTPQAAPMVGPDGTIYAHVVGDNITAVRDSGDSLKVLWVREISVSPYSPFAHFAVGPDSTVYVASNGRILRLDPADGMAIDSSLPINDGNIFQCRLAIDRAGRVYASNGGFSSGALYCFSQDLELRWSVPVASINTSGPAIGSDGILTVAGNGTTLLAYRTPTATRDLPARPRPVPMLLARPNPFRSRTAISLRSAVVSSSGLTIYDAGGARVRTLQADSYERPAISTFVWDGCDQSGRRMPAGAYIGEAGGTTISLVLTR
ncbi:MAG: PQQ-binding-like beta-propeller repeat protein [candidate division WOR-3 bacterium]